MADGSKTFEVRKNDRGFQPGDIVDLQEWDPTIVSKQSEHYGPYGYTSNPILRFKIGYILPIDVERVVFSLLPMDSK